MTGPRPSDSHAALFVRADAHRGSTWNTGVIDIHADIRRFRCANHATRAVHGTARDVVTARETADIRAADKDIVLHHHSAALYEQRRRGDLRERVVPDLHLPAIRVDAREVLAEIQQHVVVDVARRYGRV